MRFHALIPQKALPLAKSRLRIALGAGDRARLALRLLHGVWEALRAVPSVEEVFIMTLDPVVRAQAAAWGACVVSDPAPTLNAALAQTIQRMVRSDRGTLVVAADLPYLRPAEVAALLAAGGEGTLVIAPSASGTGTNALLLPPGLSLRPAYGPASRMAHRALARTLDLRVTEVILPGLAFDLDTPGDLRILDGARRLL